MAALTESTLLRQSNLAVIYLAIIAFETLLVLALAVAWGDGLSTPQLAGGVLVVAGIALVSA